MRSADTPPTTCSTQLKSDAGVVDQVRTSDIVEIEIGANDVAHSGSCGTSVACYEPTIPVVEKNLAAIVARIHELTAGRQCSSCSWTTGASGSAASTPPRRATRTSPPPPR